MTKLIIKLIHLAVLLLLAASCLPTSNARKLRGRRRPNARPCPGNEHIIGYVSIADLNQDIENLVPVAPRRWEEFTLCPGTDFDTGTLEVRLPKTRIQCGATGRVQGRCRFIQPDGPQVIIHTDDIFRLDVNGVTFEGWGTDYSVKADTEGTPGKARVRFNNCKWTGGDEGVYETQCVPDTSTCATADIVFNRVRIESTQSRRGYLVLNHRGKIRVRNTVLDENEFNYGFSCNNDLTVVKSCFQNQKNCMRTFFIAPSDNFKQVKNYFDQDDYLLCEPTNPNSYTGLNCASKGLRLSYWSTDLNGYACIETDIRDEAKKCRASIY